VLELLIGYFHVVVTFLALIGLVILLIGRSVTITRLSQEKPPTRSRIYRD
jgi:uncharacterized membrane protein